MTTYRALAMIPTAAVLPGESEPTLASYAEVLRAIRALSRFAPDMDTYSHGMCTIELSVRVVGATLPSSVYETVAGSQIIFPRSLAQYLGDFGEYDLNVLMNPSNLTTSTTFRGVGGVSSSTPWAWVKIGSDEPEILVHEFGHALTAYLSVTTGDYTNFPDCSPEPAMHCNADYGFASDYEPGWLEGFMSGLPDGTAMTATAWAVQTPTERGAKTLPSYRERMTPWGLIGPVVISEAP